MQFSEHWLRTMANPDMSSEDLAHLLTMSGLEVEEVEPVAPPFSNVVVAKVLDVEKHPNAVGNHANPSVNADGAAVQQLQ